MERSVAESFDYCRALARTTGRNFYYSFLTLPREQRDAMCALYAFMRITDDLGDSDEPPETRAAQLARWREGLLAACEGGPCDHPALPALAEIVKRHSIPVRYLLDVIAGVEMDLVPAAYATFDELARYCYHVAGAVGLACIHLWGFHDPRALDSAVDCGAAFQLTNILRDLGEDASRGRVYLPREDLDRFGIGPAELAAAGAGLARDDRFQQLMRFEVARAREYYARARALFEYLDLPGKPILETMLRIYGGLLDEIERRKYDVFSRRVALSRGRKLWIAGSVIIRDKLGLR
ncbi:MAG: phytoene/squalene synthase family protein [Planctomycetia bacterium]|nr:phytoene/squalene synthase family protein [Planctomycetia bacterium]